jgi:hypothetical protein
MGSKGEYTFIGRSGTLTTCGSAFTAAGATVGGGPFCFNHEFTGTHREDRLELPVRLRLGRSILIARERPIAAYRAADDGLQEPRPRTAHLPGCRQLPYERRRLSPVEGKRQDGFIPLAERLKAYARRDAIEASARWSNCLRRLKSSPDPARATRPDTERPEARFVTLCSNG